MLLFSFDVKKLGYSKASIGEGGIKNRLFGSRGRSWGKLDLFFVRYNRAEVGLEAEMIVKIWAHPDAYKAKYEENIAKFDPSKDKFNLAEFFPPKDYGKSFIIIINTTIKDGKITLKSQYSPYWDSPPADLAAFIINNPEKTTEKTADIKKDEVFTLITEKMFPKIVGFFVSGNRGDILFPGEYGKFQNTLTTWPQLQDISWLTEDHLKSENEKYLEYLNKIVKSFQDLVKKIMQNEEAKTKCDN